MGVRELASAIASAVNKNTDDGTVKRGRVSGSTLQVDGRSYSYTAAVDIPIDDGDWVYVMLSDSKAVVVGR